MGDSEDSDTEYCGMKQPPLVKQLKNILDQYPNNGQIIKELVQNAEDAGASEMKILFDSRNINQSVDNKKYNKYFKGPALCFYNDAVFTDKDWDGISMIHSSVKEDDPLAVGRFGLGFKSVFHLTDNPIIISGEKIMFIDPHEEKTDHVCSTKTLKSLNKSKRIDTECVLSALQDTFEFSHETIDTGQYNGTLFWFSLRKAPTALSEAVYDGDEIEELLRCFQNEAVNVLLFLSHIQKMKLFRRTNDDLMGKVKTFSVCLDVNLNEFRQSLAIQDIPEISISNIMDVVIKTEAFKDDHMCLQSHEWLVVKLFKGAKMSERFRSLIQDKNLSYSPCVGVAAPLHSNVIDFKGHVFCCLPLPMHEAKESESLTELPVHVNGFFALSQNRSQLKWPTLDQTMLDKSAEWNRCLLEEAVPEAYCILLKRLIDVCIIEGNVRDWVDRVYRCIPDITKVTGKWKLMVDSLIPRVLEREFIFTEADGGKWIRPEDASLASFEDLTVDTDVEQTVKETLKCYNENLADVPIHVLTILKKYQLATEILPGVLKQILNKNHNLYQGFSSSDNVNLLRFLLCDQQYNNVQDLVLLPLASGNFTTFSKEESSVFIATVEEVEMFHCSSDKLICPEMLPDDLRVILRSDQISGLYQLQNLNVESVNRFLWDTITKTFGTDLVIQFGSMSVISWLSKVWEYIQHRFDIKQFLDLPLLPVEGPEVWQLHRLTEVMILKELSGFGLSDGVCRALESMSVIVVKGLPSWLTYDTIQLYLHSPSIDSVLYLLGRLSCSEAQQFNKMCNGEDRDEFVSYLGNCQKFDSVDRNAKLLLKQLQLFHKKTSSWDSSSWVSLQEINTILDGEEFPVPYPKPFIVYGSAQERNLAEKLGAEYIDTLPLILHTLEALNTSNNFHPSYSTEDTITFMKWLLPSLHKYASNTCLLETAKSVAFIKSAGTVRKASEVFDPSEDLAMDLFAGENVFSNDKQFHEEPMLSGLRQLGLRNIQDLEHTDLLRIGGKLDEMSNSVRVDHTVMTKCKALLEILEKYPGLLSSSFRELQFIFPKQERETGYPDMLPWFKSDTCLVAPSNVTSARHSSLVGSVHAVIDCCAYPQIEKYFKWDEEPELDTILLNFQIVIQNYDSSKKPQVLSIIENTYAYLSCQPLQEVKRGIRNTFENAEKGVNLILCEDGFICSSKIFLEDSLFNINLQPYLYKIPNELLKFSRLFGDLGCHQHLTAELLLTTLERINETHESSSRQLNDVDVRKDLHMVVSILNQIHDAEDTTILKGKTVLVPIYTGDSVRLHLKPAHECIYFEENEGNATLLREGSADQEATYNAVCYEGAIGVEGTNTIYRVHPEIAEATAKQLGVMTKRRRRLQDNSVAISFGQKESLATRLRGLLKGYPCDAGIMKELIQNADDAKATEIHFIKDYRTHRSEKVFDDKFCAVQGPSLCVFNDSAFTQKDLQGIQNLGIGSKSEDPIKTGQYGVGFNAVYNLTDAPSFLTKGPDIENNETLCFFDPTCKYIPNSDERDPGVRFIDLQKLRREYPDVFIGYLEEELFVNREKGTVFRLPLRTEESDISHHVVSPEQLDTMFVEFERDILTMLLFVRNVTKITISNITSGQLVEEYAVDVSLSEECKFERETFFQSIDIFAQSFKISRHSILEMPWSETGYKMAIRDNRGNDSSWYIVQRIGYNKTTLIPTGVQNAFENGDIGLLPHGGVALLLPEVYPMENSENKVGISGSAKAFCFLPLPVHTGLPVQVHGHFALNHEARRALWEGGEGYRMQWNESVLRYVVAPAYVSALKFCLEYISDTWFSKHLTLRMAYQHIREFEKYFPLPRYALGSHWKFLSKCVYKTIIDSKEKLFPVFEETVMEPEDLVSVSWIALKEDNNEYPAYFVLRDRLNELINILQKLGMKIIRTSKNIQEAITESDRKGLSLSQASVITFLKSFRSSFKDKCNIGGLDRLVEETPFQDLKNVQMVAEFCFTDHTEESQESYSGLPLLVTNDGYLRELNMSSPAFVTTFCDLLPASSHLFINSNLVSSYQTYLVEQKLCKEFSLSDFVQLLSHNIERQRFCTGDAITWTPDGDVIPNKEWLKMLWEFIWECSDNNSANFDKTLKTLGDWSIVPSVHKKLHPISQLYTFIDKGSFQFGSSVRKALQQLKIPELEITSLSDVDSLSVTLSKCIPSDTKPKEVIRCLHYHRELLCAARLIPGEANGILHYFADNLCHLTQTNETLCIKNNLKALPLFVTLYNTVVCIKSDTGVFVLPSEMPCDGMERWATSEEKVILKLNRNSSLITLFHFLGLKITYPIYFYRDNVLTMAREMEASDFLQHLEYIRDKLLSLPWNKQYTSNQDRLICKLKNTPFIQIGQSVRMLREFKSPCNALFQLICAKDDFLPDCFDLEKWHEFFERIGLQVDMTEELYMQFARQIELEGGINGLTEQVIKKSLALSEHLIGETNESISSETLSKLASVKFIVPAKVKTKYISLHARKENAVSLICYEDSVPYKLGKICWTTVHLLPKEADPNWLSNRNGEWLSDNLHICSTLSIRSIIRHCQILGDALKEQLPQFRTSYTRTDWIFKLMDRLYKVLQDKEYKGKLPNNSLLHTPFVLFPDNLEILLPSSTVLGCSNAQEIPPYLRRVPTQYDRYGALFKSQGTADNPTLAHYVNVLSSVQRKIGNEKINPSELETIRRAIGNMFEILKNRKCPMDHQISEILYLPDSEMHLVDARSLMVFDDTYIEARVKTETHFRHFLGLKMLEIQDDDIDTLKYLPHQWRPMFITEVTTEEVDTSKLEKIRGKVSLKWENFLRSSEFAGGILRLRKWQSARCHTISKNEEAPNDATIIELFQKLTVWEVKGLNTYIKIKEINGHWRRVSQSEIDIACFVEYCQQNDVYNIYLQVITDETDISWDINVGEKLVEIINSVTKTELDIFRIIMILRLVDQQQQIHVSLNKVGVPEYTYTNTMSEIRSVFPKPGTFVPLKFLPFLDHGISRVEEQQYMYVAMELEDPLVDDENTCNTESSRLDQRFIYVRITECVDRQPDAPFQMYLVNIGQMEDMKVPAYKLYKFLRQGNSGDVSCSDKSTSPLQPLEDDFTTIRKWLSECWIKPEREKQHIIKRLLLQWNPERNANRKDYCTRMYIYLQECILRLEAKIQLEDIAEDVDGANTASESPPDFTSSKYKHIFDIMDERSRSHRRQYYQEAISNRLQQENAIVYNHDQEVEKIPYPYPEEAERWLLQAKADVQDALLSMQGQHAYNWICYKCHQAVEKGLKAAWFFKDANELDRRATRLSHHLEYIAFGLDEQLSSLASKLTRITGNHTRMRYPDTYGGNKIPVDQFNKEQAQETCEIARKVLEHVSKICCLQSSETSADDEFI